MSHFNDRWQACARRARETPRRDETAPFGFASRVLAASARPTPNVETLEAVWQRFTLRSLAALAVVLVICALIETPHLRNSSPLQTGIENAVAQLVWSL